MITHSNEAPAPGFLGEGALTVSFDQSCMGAISVNFLPLLNPSLLLSSALCSSCQCRLLVMPKTCTHHEDVRILKYHEFGLNGCGIN